MGVLRSIATKDKIDERHKGTGVTITAGLGCPRKFAINRMLDVHVDPSKMWAAQRGTWLHEQMAHALEGEDGWITEESDADACTFSGRLFGIDMSCRVDARRADFSAVHDYKFRSALNARYMDPTGAAKTEDAAQLNMARLLMEQTTGLELSGMEMRIWVDSLNWTPTFAPLMSEGEIGDVRPGGANHTVREIFMWEDATMRMWERLGAPYHNRPPEVPINERRALIKAIPMVGEAMFVNAKNHTNMCSNYCEVKDECFGIEGDL